MNFETANRWLTLLANFAVLVGIIVLAVEIRQNTIALRAGAYQARSDALHDLSMRVAESEVLATIEANLLVRRPGCAEFESNCDRIDDVYFESLSPTERQQYKRYITAHFFRLENLLFQYRQGALTDEYHDQAVVPTIRYYLPLWEKFGVWQRGRMIEYLEGIDGH
jgi:hypothetical protein